MLFPKWSARYELSLLGLLQGVLIYLAIKLLSSETYLGVFAVTFIILFILTWQLTTRSGSVLLKLAVNVSLSGFFAAMIAHQHFFGIYVAPGLSTLNFVELLVAWYIMACFYWVFSMEGKFLFPYPELFRIAWDSLFILAIASLFNSLCWLVLEFWQVLFYNLGIGIFGDIFHSPPFLIIATTTFVGLGLAIAQESHQVIFKLRQIVLSICYLLLVPIAFIGLTYFLVALFRPYQALDVWGLLLAIAVAGILFLNGVVQDGQAEVKYSRWIRRVLNVLFAILPIPVAITLLIPFTDMAHHGFGLLEFVYLKVIILVLAYSVCYSIAVFKRGQSWMHFVTQANPYLALLLVAMLVFGNTSLYDFAPRANTVPYSGESRILP